MNTSAIRVLWMFTWKRLREKIKDHANWSLATVWGIGYKFEVRDL